MVTFNNDQYIQNISKISSSNNVTDENINLSISEIENNINYLANLISNLNGSANNSNLMDYNENGEKIYINGGVFNSFENKNSWLAIENSVVVNDKYILTDMPYDGLIWTAPSSTVESSASTLTYLQRDFYIPPEMRGSELVFSLKGIGINQIPQNISEYDILQNEIETENCALSEITSGTSGDPCISRYEDVIVQIIGADVNTPFFMTLGPAFNHKYIRQNSNELPPYLTSTINFKVSSSTTNLKIKIYRTQSSGAIILSNAFLGNIVSPYDNYDIKNIDINFLYNFTNNIPFIHATTVMGHSVADSNENIKQHHLVTYEQYNSIKGMVKEINDFDWDQISGPTLIDLDNLNESTPKVSVFEFDYSFARYLHFNMKVDGPSPSSGLYMGINYFVDSATTGNVIFDVYVKIVKPGESGNPDFSEYRKFSFTIPITISPNTLGYIELHENFFQDLDNTRGCIAYVTISRDGSIDSYNGNFLLANVKFGIGANLTYSGSGGTIITDPCEV